MGETGGDAMDAGEGSGWGYCDGGVGFGRRPDELVKGCTASGSKDAKTECDMVNRVVMG